MIRLQEKENDNKQHDPSRTPISNDELKNVASTLFKDQNFDIGQVVSLASNLVANENVMKSVIDFAKLSPRQQEPLQTVENEKSEQPQLSKQIEEMEAELTQVKEELQRIKEQNEEIKEAVLNIQKRTSKKFLGIF